MNASGRPGLAICAVFALAMLGPGGPAQGQGQAVSPAKPAGDACLRSSFLTVVDVGHTVDVPGAMSARNVPEYAFNLQSAQDIKQALTDAGFDKTVLLITATAPWRGLVERAAKANSMHADLFIAIHHDSVPDDLLQTWQYEGQDNRYNDDYPGYALFISNDNGDRAGSLLFGQLLGQRTAGARPAIHAPLYAGADGPPPPRLVDAKAGVYRYDQLIVLRKTRMPALLLEAGSIVNRQEELQLGTVRNAAR